MSDALSRILSAGVSLAEVERMSAEGLTVEEIAAAVDSIEARGEKAWGAEESGATKPEDFSDAGNMEAFSGLNAGQLMYTDSRGWLCWDGMRWTADDHRAHEKALAFTQAMLTDAQNAYRDALYAQANAKANNEREAIAQASEVVKQGKAYLDHALRSRAERRVKSILGLAKHRFAISPARLDANPAELNTPAGIVDLATGKLRPADKTALCTMMTACEPGEMGAAIQHCERVNG